MNKPLVVFNPKRMNYSKSASSKTARNASLESSSGNKRNNVSRSAQTSFGTDTPPRRNQTLTSPDKRVTRDSRDKYLRPHSARNESPESSSDDTSSESTSSTTQSGSSSSFSSDHSASKRIDRHGLHANRQRETNKQPDLLNRTDRLKFSKRIDASTTDDEIFKKDPKLSVSPERSGRLVIKDNVFRPYSGSSASPVSSPQYSSSSLSTLTLFGSGTSFGSGHSASKHISKYGFQERLPNFLNRSHRLGFPKGIVEDNTHLRPHSTPSRDTFVTIKSPIKEGSLDIDPQSSSSSKSTSDMDSHSSS